MDMVFLVVWYVLFMFGASSFLWGRSAERAYEFHRHTYWGRLLGQRAYSIVTKSIAVVSMLGASFGVILVLLKKMATVEVSP